MLFTAKNTLFKKNGLLDEIKRVFTGFISTLTFDEKDKLHVFDRNGMYLATKKIGKNNSKVAEIEEYCEEHSIIHTKFFYHEKLVAQKKRGMNVLESGK